MDSIDDAEARALIQAFFREHVQPRGEQLGMRSGHGFLAPASISAESYFAAPVVAEPAKTDFATPDLSTIDQLADAMEQLWREAGVSVEPALARRLAELAFRLKADGEYGAEPPPFIYTL